MEKDHANVKTERTATAQRSFYDYALISFRNRMTVCNVCILAKEESYYETVEWIIFTRSVM